jgi:hypothetical protein
MSDPTRQSHSSNHPRQIKLSQIEIDQEHDYCHRSEEALKPKNLEKLANNLAVEGQATPLVVVNSGRTNSLGLIIFILISGFRRFFALHEAIRLQLDIHRIHAEMLVDVVEMVRGEGQSEESFQQDLLSRSIVENEQRLNFTVPEKLGIVRTLRAAGTPDPRAASDMCISETQYGRYLAIVSEPWMHEHVIGDCLGTTDAAELVKAAREHNRLKEVREDLEMWVADCRRKIEQKRREKEKIGKKLTSNAEQVKSYASRELTKHWIKLIAAGKRFDQDVQFHFGILVDTAAGTIQVPRAELKLSELSVEDLQLLIGELNDGINKMLPLLKERQLFEQARSMTDEERQQELARIGEERRRRQQEEEEANAGRPAEDFGVVPPPHLADVDVDDEEVADAASQTAVEANAGRPAEGLGQIEEEADDDAGPSPDEGEASAAEHEDDNEDREEADAS